MTGERPLIRNRHPGRVS